MSTYISESKVIEMNALYCLSYSTISHDPENEAMDFMLDYEKKHHLNPLKHYGHDIPVSKGDSEKGLRGYCYLIVLLQEDFENFEGMQLEKKIIPKSKYLTLIITDPFENPFERIPNGWKKLSEDIESSYEFDDSEMKVCFEEILTVENKVTMRIFAPIK